LKIKIILLGIFSLGIVGGMISQVTDLFQKHQSITAVFMMLGVVSFIAYITNILKNLYSDVKLGLPSEDERSKKIKLYSAGRAYFYSLYIWILLLIFQKHLDRDDILILGLLGMVMSLFLSWLLTRKKKGLEE
jgi:hypothetical protein